MKGPKPKSWRTRLGSGSAYRRDPKRKDRAALAKRVNAKLQPGPAGAHIIAAVIMAAQTDGKHEDGK